MKLKHSIKMVAMDTNENLTVNELVEKHIGFTESIAKKLIKKFGMTENMYDELRSAGYVGLMEAASKWLEYKEANKANFKYFAFIRIKGAMIDSLRKGFAIGDKYYKYAKAYSAVAFCEEKLVPVTEEEKKDEDIAKVFDLVSKGAMVFRLSQSSDAIERGVSDTSKSPEEILSEKERNIHLRKVLKKLSPKEQMVIEEYYFKGKSFQQIAEETNEHSRSWLARIHLQALKKLQEIMDEM